MGTHSSDPVRRILWTEKPGQVTVYSAEESDRTKVT